MTGAGQGEDLTSKSLADGEGGGGVEAVLVGKAAGGLEGAGEREAVDLEGGGDLPGDEILSRDGSVERY